MESDLTLHTVPLAVFLEEFEPAYYADNAWEQIPALLSALPSEKATIDILRDTLRAGSEYTEPITVDAESKQVTNGMHRLCAAILEKKDTITYTHALPSVDAPVQEIEFRLIPQGTLPIPRALTQDKNDEYNEAIDWIRSFPLNGMWTTSDSFAGCNGTWTGWWYCPSELVGELQHTIQQRIRQHTRLAAVIVSVKEDAEYGTDID